MFVCVFVSRSDVKKHILSFLKPSNRHRVKYDSRGGGLVQSEVGANNTHRSEVWANKIGQSDEGVNKTGQSKAEMGKVLEILVLKNEFAGTHTFTRTRE